MSKANRQPPAPITALVTARAGYDVRVLLMMPLAPKGSTTAQRLVHNRKRDAWLSATGHRLAAEIKIMNLDVGAWMAVDAQDATVTCELGAKTDVSVVQCLVGDALAALKIPFEHRAEG